MGGGHPVHVEDFTVGGGAAMEFGAVPRSDTGFRIIVIDRGIVPDTRNLIGLADLVDGALSPGGFIAGDAADLLGGVKNQFRGRASIEKDACGDDDQPEEAVC